MCLCVMLHRNMYYIFSFQYCMILVLTLPFYQISYADIVVYLLYTTSFITLEEVKIFKSLQSYKYFTAGWVIDHKWKMFQEACLIIGKVNHSYAMSAIPLNPWVIVKTNGTIVCGHCTCMAGLGETC